MLIQQQLQLAIREVLIRKVFSEFRRKQPVCFVCGQSPFFLQVEYGTATVCKPKP
jgi:hypothetical protein